MNNEAYSCYPSEAEVLLSDGCDIVVLAVDSNVNIQNKLANSIEYFNKKHLTVVHLFHTGSFKEPNDSKQIRN